jgi:uncharacterized protein with HEPN domain
LNKDPRIFLDHIRYSISLIEEYSLNVTKDDFLSSTQLQDSIIRRIEIIGEAVKKLPDGMRRRYPDIQWKEIIGMRDILAHGYLSVDLELTWKVVTQEIPKLKDKIEKIISETN